MTDLAGAVQIALYTALSAVEGLPPVVSETPINGQDQVDYPFVLLGDDSVTQVGSKTARLERHEVSIHVCMQGATKLAVRGVQEQVRAALQFHPITAPGATLSEPEALNQTTSLLEDGATYVGSQLFVILPRRFVRRPAMSTTLLGNNYLLWIGAPGSTGTALTMINGQGTCTKTQSQAKIDTASKTTGGYATSAPGLKDITLDLDIIVTLPDTGGYSLLESQANAIPNVAFPVEIRKNGANGAEADAVFSALMFGTITSTAFTQNDKVAVKAQFLLAAAPTVNTLA